jgi:hypothetical protein
MTHPGGAESLQTGHTCTISGCGEVVRAVTMETWHATVRHHYATRHGVLAPIEHACTCRSPLAARFVSEGARAGTVRHEPTCPRWRP